MTDSTHRYAMIMAGGAGKRLWPMSRQSRPKQLLPFIGGRTLLELATDRLEGTVPVDRRFICTSESFRDAILNTIPGFESERIFGEPVGRDTVNAVGLTAAILHHRDPHALFAVLTADHLIEPQDEFRRKLAIGFELLEANPHRFVTFGIAPTYPAESYGYVERGAPIAGYEDSFATLRFKEKPKEAVAREFLAAGNFDWNSGMFVFPAATYLAAMKRFLPESHAGLSTIAAAWDTRDRQSVLEAIYPTLHDTSVDFGVMEPASKDTGPDRIEICTVRLELSWIDVGSWSSYAETLTANGDGNRTNGNAVHIKSKNVLAVSSDPDHLITTIGCNDLIVVHTDDATLVCRADRDQDVKTMAGKVAEGLR